MSAIKLNLIWIELNFQNKAKKFKSCMLILTGSQKFCFVFWFLFLFLFFFWKKKISMLKILIQTPLKASDFKLNSVFFTSAGKCRGVEWSTLCRSRKFAKATEEVTCNNYINFFMFGLCWNVPLIQLLDSSLHAWTSTNLMSYPSK